jgi:ABC-2 type transport system permease protein
MTSEAITDADLPAEAAAADGARTRPFYWSVRRELWENRSLFIAPLAMAGVSLFGFLVSLGHLPTRMFTYSVDGGRHNHAVIAEAPYIFVAAVILATNLIVALFYTLGALQHERRDRSILFWKSLPVSDLTTVLAKLFVPLVVLPLIGLAVSLATLSLMWGISAADAALTGSAVAAAWAHAPIAQGIVPLVYAFIVLALWYAPVTGYLLLVGGWAKRVSFLWAVGVPIALSVTEQIAFGTKYVQELVNRRLGAPPEAFNEPPPHSAFVIDSSLLNPMGLLESPDFWTGLAFAAAFVAAAVWLRRYRDPIF